MFCQKKKSTKVEEIGIPTKINKGGKKKKKEENWRDFSSHKKRKKKKRKNWRYF